ncbi:TMV resistance protein N-like [Juglans regia]|uniref:TMV resistance protein N-like n=1 Tax=Juglans regia TaxID=51240 RepID=A0A6P9EWV2_JUGRE|nr:TMV resistance protein N-like [Juglans regia]
MILQGLSRNFSTLSKDLVGIESRVEEMMNILGIGGGKTTLAEVIYDRISYQFEASNFIACIREETRNRGLVSLQKQLLSKLFMERAIHIWDDCEGMNMIQNRLCYEKVFLVLDDVDREEHLTTLAGSRDWFGLGPRIILTSIDNHLLKRHGVNYIYMVNELNNDEALQLFSLAAFKKPHPEENYVDLSKGFVKYAQGLPLALKVLGSSLFGRGTNARKGAWDQLKAIPNKGILDTLQVLDNILMDILESFGYYPYLNIDILMEKCLITISSKRLRMHDLLQKTGQEIIYDEFPKEPGRRSRLWHYKDVLHMLKNNTGTDVIEGIVLNLPNQNEERLCSFGSLKLFYLSGSQNLLETLDFTGVPSLETLDLEGCTSLSKDMNGEGYLEQLYKGGTAIKFTKFFAVPEFGSNDACSTQEMFMTNDDSIAAFYIGFDDRVYYIRCLNHEESNLQTKGYDVENNCFNPKVMSGPSLGAEIQEYFNMRSYGSRVTLQIHPNLDNNSKWEGYIHCTFYEVDDEVENSDPRIFKGNHPDHGQFVEFVYHFETNEGP